MDYFLSQLSIHKSPEITFKDAVKIKRIHPWLEAPPDLYPEFMLSRLMLANSGCRTLPPPERRSSGRSAKLCPFSDEEEGEEGLVHPMDVLSYLYLRAHPLFRQSLSLQLSRCQLSVPLVIRDPVTSQLVFFQFALSSVIKNYKTKSIPVSLSVCSESLPVVAFLRVGDYTHRPHSKSQLLNKLFGNRNECFFNRNLAGSIKNRVLFDGTIEAAWYVPSGVETNDLHSTPITFLNLRGDALLHPLQRSLLASVSTIAFIFFSMNDLQESEFERLKEIYSQCDNRKVILVIVTQNQEKASMYVDAFPDPFGHVRLSVGSEASNVRSLRGMIKDGLREHSGAETSLNRIQHEAEQLGMKLDSSQIPYASLEAVGRLTSLLYSPPPPDCPPIKFCLPLQHTGWYEWCEAQRELHTICSVSDNVDELRERIEIKCKAARQEQYSILMEQRAPFVIEFTSFCKQLNVQPDSFEYLWNILTTQLDTNNRIRSRFPSVPPALLNSSLSLELLSSLSIYQQNQSSESLPIAPVTGMIPVIHAEHILRELGQLFEVYDSATVQEKRELDKILPFSPVSLPQFAAELLLRGHSFELLDGEANHVPVRWVKRVLEALSIKVGRDKRLLVIGIIGVQSSGKSTLLNTMFGLHFAVSSARCTRGVLMQLIAVSVPKAGFDYVILLDTEGLAQQEHQASRKHDNELATFVVGLSDLTIVNISMETSVEVQNILQITVLALIRMQLTYSRPKCIFVHQNVVDIMASANLEEQREKLIAFLNENTRAVYKHQTDKVASFDDVIDFTPSQDVWYFPGLLEGQQSMSWVSENYSKKAEELRHYILASKRGDRNRFQIGEWALKLENIWLCVLKEDFVFHYKNVKEINDHFELDSVLAGWSFQFSNEMSQWASDAINQLSNCGCDDLDTVWNRIQEELGTACETIFKERQLEIIQEYFESAPKKDSFMKWRDRTVDLFTRNRTREQQRIETDCSNFYAAQMRLQLIKQHFERVKSILSEKAKDLFEQVKKENRPFDSPEVINELFEEEWTKWLASIPSRLFKTKREEIDIKRDIQKVILTAPCLQVIRNDEKIKLCEVMTDYTVMSEIKFELGEQHFSVNDHRNGNKEIIKRPYLSFSQLLEAFKASTGLFSASTHDNENVHYTKAQKFIDDLNDKCEEFVNNLPANANYSKSYVISLIELIATETNKYNFDEKSSAETCIEFSNLFILEFSFYQCCKASRNFKLLQDSFLERTNPRTQLELLKTDLKKIFASLCEGIQKEDSSSALLASLLMEGIRKAVSDTLQRVAVLKFTQEPEHENIYKTRQLLHLQVLKDLAKRKVFHSYMQYIHCPLQYMETWIKRQLVQYCTMQSSIDRLKHEVLDPAVREKIELITESGVAAIPNNSSEQLSSDAWNVWKAEFHSRISSSVRDIDIDSLSRIDTYAITNLPQFCQFLTQHLHQLAGQFDWKNWIHGLMIRGLPSQSLISSLLECRALCPFCREPCQRGGTDHQHYCGSFHRPKGIGGCFHNIINTLSVAECTSSVGSNKRFWYGNKNYAYSEYTKVNDLFASWRILPEDAIESRYWQWVLFHFQKQFCAQYGYAPNRQVARWSGLTEEDIVEDLERHYQNFCFRAK